MKFGSSTMQYACSLAGALALTVFLPSHAAAQNAKAQAQSHHGPGPKGSGSELINAVKEATERFRDVSVAEGEGYGLMFGCVSGPDSGAMGLHYVNMAFAGDTELDPAKPEIVIYEPQPDGRLKLVGADFLVFADAWNAAHPEATPQLGGQLLHLFETPNRFGLPAFYTLHVWAWKDNPNGAFVNWHPKVSCEAFNGQTQSGGE